MRRFLVAIFLALLSSPSISGSLGGVPLPIIGKTQTRAASAIAAYSDAMAVDFTDCSMAIKDSVTPANNYRGPFINRVVPTGGSWVNCTSQGGMMLTKNFFNIATSILPYSATVGTLVAAGRMAGPTVVSVGANFSDSTANNRVTLGSIVTTGVANGFVNTSNVTQANMSSVAAIEAWAIVKIATAWAANDFSLVKDGATAVTDAAGTVPTMTDLQIGSRSGATSWNGPMLTVIYLKQRMSDAAMQTATASQ